MKNEVKLTQTKEPRIDSRLVAKEMGIKHLSIMALISNHKSILKEFGSLPFQIETKKRIKGGTTIKYTLINENQFDLISRLVRGKNHKKIIDFKIRVTKAFAENRKRETVKREYLPYYHESRDLLATMQGVKKHHFINLANAENKIVGLSSGERQKANNEQLGLLICLQKIETNAFEYIDSPTEAIREVSRRFNQLANLISPRKDISNVDR